MKSMCLLIGIKSSDLFTLKISNYPKSSLWYYDLINAPFGKLIVAGSSPSISYIAFYETEKKAITLLNERCSGIILKKQMGIFEPIKQLLQRGKIDSKILLSISGTDFQMRVWEKLLRVPLGKTISYGELAAAIGNPGASRAVGTAVGKNPIAYFIPCHRVLASGGSIGGYYWGTAIKKKILDWEMNLLTQ